MLDPKLKYRWHRTGPAAARGDGAGRLPALLSQPFVPKQRAELLSYQGCDLSCTVACSKTLTAVPAYGSVLLSHRSHFSSMWDVYETKALNWRNKRRDGGLSAQPYLSDNMFLQALSFPWFFSSSLTLNTSSLRMLQPLSFLCIHSPKVRAELSATITLAGYICLLPHIQLQHQWKKQSPQISLSSPPLLL